jgi:transposase-like protein
MGNANFSDEFRRDAVAQITEQGYDNAKTMADAHSARALRHRG